MMLGVVTTPQAIPLSDPFYKPWVAEEWMHGMQRTSSSNIMHSQSRQGKWGVPIRVRHWDLLSVKG